MNNTRSKIAVVAVAALAMTAFAAAQSSNTTYSWGTPTLAVAQNSAPLVAAQPEMQDTTQAQAEAQPGYAIASNAGLGGSGTPALASNYRGSDVLGTINDVVYGKPHTGRTIGIIAGSAAGGAVLGGITYGKKGALIGAVAGGVAGWAIDRATRHKTIFGY